MVAPRPVDLFTPPSGFRHSRVEAMSLSRCARCGDPVNRCGMTDEDGREWEISALCPECFDWATKDCEE